MSFEKINKFKVLINTNFIDKFTLFINYNK